MYPVESIRLARPCLFCLAARESHCVSPDQVSVFNTMKRSPATHPSIHPSIHLSEPQNRAPMRQRHSPTYLLTARTARVRRPTRLSTKQPKEGRPKSGSQVSTLTTLTSSWRDNHVSFSLGQAARTQRLAHFSPPRKKERSRAEWAGLDIGRSKGPT
ncbi:hypothetical protein IWX50DRAFT_343015 [Phyllosticta citricarpa]|uniref:Uncharacterized protein n=1 Tax=Phyllosticta citricarpa TaxID=55181 RepID=A0ABR1LBB3_9PEZI